MKEKLICTFGKPHNSVVTTISFRNRTCNQLNMNLFFMGVAAALLSSASWAMGSVLWKRMGDRILPESMNLTKGIIGCFYLAVPLLWLGIQPVEPRSFFLLVASGFIGISLGDTFFFRALSNLSPRQTSLIRRSHPTYLTTRRHDCTRHSSSPLEQ